MEGRGGSALEESPDGGAVSVVRKVAEVREVSVAALPAYPAAYTMAAPSRPVTPAQARCHAAVERMRRAMAGAVSRFAAWPTVWGWGDDCHGVAYLPHRRDRRPAVPTVDQRPPVASSCPD